MREIESAITPEQLVAKFAKAGISISERTLRERARQVGAYRLIGKTMFLMPEDVEKIIEAAKPMPRKSALTEPKRSARKRMS
ncbi:hypothetical protein [Rhizobium hidalgonense]|nr:hypothetical protein [Rhizobium hidalgonense]